MCIQTSFHADHGEFLGLRLSRGGRLEVVYDNGPAMRRVWRVTSPHQSSPEQEAFLSDALRTAAAASPRVLPALHQALKKHAITLEAQLF